MRPRADSLLDPIVALATPAGRSALAVVRLSGARLVPILSAVVPRLPEPLEPRRASLVRLVDEAGEPLDRGLLTFFPGPASYTGEDVAELSVHGSPVVVERLLSALGRAGARLARPGEFTERAFHHGRMDLPRAGAVRDLIEARTGEAARLSASRLEGGLSRRLCAVREELMSAAAFLAAAIDFAEDVGEEVPGAVGQRLSAAAAALSRLSATYETGRLLTAGCRVVVLGRPNAGKSTLFNALVGSARAIVTDVAGTTRDTLESAIEVAGVPVTLVDTAGLRETDELVERIGVQRAREEAERADVILYVLDASQGWTPEDRAAVESFGGRVVLAIANKMDRAGPDVAAALGSALPLCAIAAEAGGKLRALLEREIASRIDTESTSEVLASLRQREAVERAKDACQAGLRSLARGESPEYAATHVHAAIDALKDFLGETTAEDVLERVFSAFCIGK